MESESCPEHACYRGHKGHYCREGYTGDIDIPPKTRCLGRKIPDDIAKLICTTHRHGGCINQFDYEEQRGYDKLDPKNPEEGALIKLDKKFKALRKKAPKDREYPARTI